MQTKQANFTRTFPAAAAFVLVLMMGLLLTSLGGRAQGPPAFPGPPGLDDTERSQQGFAIAPVILNLRGKSPSQVTQVGLGSYFVNAIGDCNGCHTSGGPPNFNYAAGHNPYFLFQGPTVVDPTTYLAGGADFGPGLPFNVPPGLAYGSYVGPDVIARNLTPDKNGLPEGGHTLAQFTLILRTGIDLDHIHPTCTSPTGGPGGTPTPANCMPPPVNGAVLQTMPWPTFHNMTDDDIVDVYEYLSTIPCINNTTSTPPAGAPSELLNNCGGAPPPAIRPDLVHLENLQASRRAR